VVADHQVRHDRRGVITEHCREAGFLQDEARLRPGVLLVLVVTSWGLVMATYLGSAAQSSSTAGSSRAPAASSAVLLAEPYSFLPTPQ
jgi:hypothetical protein